MKRRSQTDEEQSAERFTKLLARREACAKGAAKGRRLQHAGESERAREATRRERSYRMNADAAMTWPLYQYALWFDWDIIPGRVWH